MATYRLPFENVPGWAVANGNFDDPSGGHGLGQPFAWDFTFPIDGGAKVLAARAGTVIDLRGNSTKVLPNGVDDLFWGPGNYVAIQHADRTIASYDHMHPNSLQVSAGQYVDQGAWIGKVGNTGSTSGGVVHLHFECHTWLTTGSTGPGSVINDIMGPSLLVHFEDTGHHSWRPIDKDSLVPALVVSRQDGWRGCVKCGGLYLSYWGVANICPAGGNHVFNESGDYVLPNNAANPPGQPGWRQCHKCAGLFYSLNPGSKCPVTTPTSAHDSTGSGGYSVVNNVANDPGQHHWRWCNKCQGIWYQDLGVSVCPADGKAHSLSGSGDYSIEVNPQDMQKNWHKCVRCQSIYLASNGPGVCPAGVGGHQGSSGSYVLVDDVTPVNSSGTKQQGWQGGWRYCKKCGALWMGLNSGSHCPTGGAHSLSGSGEYWLRFHNPPGSPAPGETGWKWCHKCQSLWSGGAGSHCPADGQTHATSGSGDYGLVLDNFIWHWCDRCQGLWLGNNGGAGVCKAGGGHSIASSSDYFLVCDPDPSATPGSPGTQPPGWQEGWRYCTKCQLLWMGLNSGSHCPVGGAHTHANQDGAWEHGNFVLRFTGGGVDLPGRQTHWKWCHKCQTLWMGSNAGSKCAADGLEHSSTGSGDYMLDRSLG